MDDIEPYNGYDGYGPGMAGPYPLDSPGEKQDNDSDTTELNDETHFPLNAESNDPRRIFKIALHDDVFSSYDTHRSSINSGYASNSLTVVSSDYNRVSIHPLGIVEKPNGVGKAYWEAMDKDMLFSPELTVAPVREEDQLISEIKESEPDLSDSPGGSGNGSGTGVVEKEEEHDPSEMPFLDHLEEFRWALLKSIFTIVTGMMVSWFISDVFFKTFTLLAEKAELPLITTKLMETLIIKLQMALVMGIILTLPLVFYFVWSFISPGLYNKEKKWILPLVLASTICFLIGVALAYFVMIPTMLGFVKTFIPENVKPMITIGNFIGLLIKFSILFGLLFQLPLISYVLAKIGIIKYTLMSRFRKHAIVVIFVIGAVLTPPDPITQVMMAIPLIILYEISIQVARFAGKKTLL